MSAYRVKNVSNFRFKHFFNEDHLLSGFTFKFLSSEKNGFAQELLCTWNWIVMGEKLGAISCKPTVYQLLDLDLYSPLYTVDDVCGPPMKLGSQSLNLDFCHLANNKLYSS